MTTMNLDELRIDLDVSFQCCISKVHNITPNWPEPFVNLRVSFVRWGDPTDFQNQLEHDPDSLLKLSGKQANGRDLLSEQPSIEAVCGDDTGVVALVLRYHEALSLHRIGQRGKVAVHRGAIEMRGARVCVVLGELGWLEAYTHKIEDLLPLEEDQNFASGLPNMSAIEYEFDQEEAEEEEEATNDEDFAEGRWEERVLSLDKEKELRTNEDGHSSSDEDSDDYRYDTYSPLY